ncbi:MAG: hypothetical protein M3280_06410 [Actinomycetota bacterium]|nr:hypothetical protein [Actinomycetota bacterium]
MRPSRTPLKLVMSFVLLVGAIVWSSPIKGVAQDTSDGAKRAGSGGVVGATLPRPQRVAALEYWTEERMRNAIPMEARVSGEAPDGDVSSDDAGGPPVSIRGRAPASARSFGGDEPEGRTVGDPEPVGYTYPFPFTRHGVDGKYTRYPYRTVGKIFFTQGGSNFVCSGASVVSSPNNAVYTAGHCVSDGAGAFSTNVVFSPARKNSRNRYGLFPGGQLWTTSAWHFNGDLTRDFAAFAVGTNGAGNTLQSRVGTLGFQYNQSRVQHWDTFGYPATGGFTGETQITCKASHAVDDTGIPGGGPDPMGIGCDSTGGASGGPWITMFLRGSFLNSVNSYKYPSTQPGAMYGPYFDILANQVRCAAATGGSTTC